jgi:hypothetical protein
MTELRSFDRAMKHCPKSRVQGQCRGLLSGISHLSGMQDRPATLVGSWSWPAEKKKENEKMTKTGTSCECIDHRKPKTWQSCNLTTFLLSGRKKATCGQALSISRPCLESLLERRWPTMTNDGIPGGPLDTSLQMFPLIN